MQCSMDWVSGDSNKSKTTTTYGKKKTFGSKACGGIASFTSLSSIGEDVDDVDFSRTTDVFGSCRGGGITKSGSWNASLKPTPLRDTSGNTPHSRSSSKQVDRGSIVKEKNICSKRTTETPLSSSSSVKISRSSPTSTIKDSVPSSSMRGSSARSSSRKTNVKKGKDVDYISILEAGRSDDIRYLKDAMESTSNSSYFSQLQLKAPKWSFKEQAILKTWLEKLGFEENYLGLTVVYRLPVDKVDIFKRDFATFNTNIVKSEFVFGLELDMEGVAPYTTESGISSLLSSSSGKLVTSVQLNNSAMPDLFLSVDESEDDGSMDFNEAENVSTENVSEEKLWIKETLGSEDFAPGVKKLIINQQNQHVGTARPTLGAPRINILRCSIDSDISSTCSTPGSGGIHRADQLSPVSQTPAGPEMNHVLSGMTSRMDNLALLGSNTDLASLPSNASNSSLSTLVESIGESKKEYEAAAIERVERGEGFRQGSFDEDDDGSETESEGEDVDEKEEGGHMDGSSALYHDSVADMPMSATFPPPRHSSSSTSSQKVWFGSVQQISCEGSPGMALAFDRSLNKSRISSCESPYVSTSSRLSTGSNDGNDGNPGFMTGFNRSLRRDIDKHPTVSNRRPPSSRNLAVPNLPRRSISDSARLNVVHSTELSAAAGAITPAGPTNRIRPIGKEFSTPNSVVGKIRSGEPGEYDWGVTRASSEESIKRLTELLNSYNIPPSDDDVSVRPKPADLRRHVSVDDRMLNRSPGDNGGRSNFRQDMMAGESPTPIITPGDARGQHTISIIPSVDDDSSRVQHRQMEHQNIQGNHPWLTEDLMAQAKKALAIARDPPVMKSAETVAAEMDDVMEDEDEDVVPELNTATVSIRDRKRLQRSMAVKRRMSISMKHRSAAQLSRHGGLQNNQLSVATVLSPATPAKYRGKKSKKGEKNRRNRSRFSPVIFQDPLMEEDEVHDHETIAVESGTCYDSLHECVLSEDNKLSERNFKGYVIGGVYQHSFDDFKPVVAPPAASDQRVIDVDLKQLPDGGTSLEIKLFVSKDKECKYIDLGPQWVWTRTAQDGYLVCSEPLRASKKIVCYYLSRHPLEWANTMDENRFSPRSPDLGDISFMSGFCQPNPMIAGYNRYGEELESFRHSLDDSQGGEGHYFSPSKNDFLNNYSGAVVGHGNTPDGLDDEGMEEELQFQRNLLFVDAPATNWDNPNIASAVLEFLFDPGSANADIGMYRLVSKSWAIGSYKLLAKHLSEIGNCQQVNKKSWVSFMRAYNWGKFLSSGACKDVYMVQDSNSQIEAVSVMDIEDLMARDMELAIKQEIEVALLCSSLVSLNICPNLVLVHSIFQSSYGVSDVLWKSKRQQPKNHAINAIIAPKASKKIEGMYQFIRMEFCTGGDLEEIVRNSRVLDIHLVKNMLFQMCFSLYACREQIGLRHYDVKLLNFFVTKGSALITEQAKRQLQNPMELEMGDNTVTMHVAFGEHDFCVPIKANGHELIKLSDFGTSSVGTGDLGEPITMQQLTTLENTPPEFLILGSTARQAYSADTFCMGLSFLHLLTGDEPYEVLMEKVKCPRYLAEQLSKYWCDFNNFDVNDPYYLICDLVRSLEYGEEDTEVPGMVLFDTIYRYVVLFGGAEDFLASSPFVDNPVWMAIVDALGLDVNEQVEMETNLVYKKKGRGRPKRNDSPTARMESITTYQSDFCRWSIHTGTHPIMVHVQNRLNQLGEGSWRLLDKLTHFDPARRCKMHEAILNPIFYSLRMNGLSVENTESSSSLFHTSFTTYKRSVDEGGTDALPLL